jgi:hypothetical protein
LSFLQPEDIPQLLRARPATTTTILLPRCEMTNVASFQPRLLLLSSLNMGARFFGR